MIHFEGFGGTGHGACRIAAMAFRFAYELGLVQDLSQLIDFAVVDKDSTGAQAPVLKSVPPITFHQAAANVGNVLREPNGPATVGERALFTRDDLFPPNSSVLRDLSAGLYARPKLANALSEVPLKPPNAPESQDWYVVVYSMIGGAGAGWGVSRVETLLASNAKVAVYAFGRYIDVKGAADPAAGWARLNELTPKTGGALILHRVEVGAAGVSQPPPSHGLQSPCQAIPAHHLLQRLRDAGGSPDALYDLNAANRQTPAPLTNAILSPGTSAADLTFGSVVPTLLAAASGAPVSLRDPAAVSQAAHDRSEEWKLLGQPLPQMSNMAEPAKKHDDWFKDGFASRSDRRAAATGFFDAIRNDNGDCKKLLLQLVALLTANKLRSETSLTRFGSVTVLATRVRHEGEPDEEFFNAAVVGAFADDLLPWTTHEMVDRLTTAFQEWRAGNKSPLRMTLLIQDDSAAAALSPRTLVASALDGVSVEVMHRKKNDWPLPPQGSNWAIKVTVDTIDGALAQYADGRVGGVDVRLPQVCGFRGMVWAGAAEKSPLWVQDGANQWHRVKGWYVTEGIGRAWPDPVPPPVGLFPGKVKQAALLRPGVVVVHEVQGV